MLCPGLQVNVMLNTYMWLNCLVLTMFFFLHDRLPQWQQLDLFYVAEEVWIKPTVAKIVVDDLIIN